MKPQPTVLATATQSQPVQNIWANATGLTYAGDVIPEVPEMEPRRVRLVEVQEGGKRFYRMVT